MAKVIPLHTCYARGCRTQGRTLFCNPHWAQIPGILKVKMGGRPRPARRPAADALRALMTAVAVIAVREATEVMVKEFSDL